MHDADGSESERRELAALEGRIGAIHLRRRLALEGRYEARGQARSARSPRLKHWVSMPGLIGAALAVSGLRARGQRNALDIRLRVNDVHLTDLPPAFDGCTLLHLSDLHLDIGPHFVERLIERVQGLSHDVCVLTGDFRFRTHGSFAPALAALARLRPLLGDSVYAVLGNHDTVSMVPGIEAMGIRVLLNESVQLRRRGEAVALVGVDDAHYFRTHDIARAMAGVAPSACAILLSHSPDTYGDAADAGFSLMLSGHTHGGQICLPGGVPMLTDCHAPRAYARGAWRHRGMAGYTSVGCGSSLVDVRFNCPPEITLHRLCRG